MAIDLVCASPFLMKPDIVHPTLELRMATHGYTISVTRPKMQERKNCKASITNINSLSFGQIMIGNAKSRTVGRFSLKFVGRAVPSRADAVPPDTKQQLITVVHLGVSLGLIVSLDKALKVLFRTASIRFPSSLFGMFCLLTLLIVLEATAQDAAAIVVAFFKPATTFIQRWLPLFYVPSLVVIPLAIQGIPAAAGAKIVGILVCGWVATLAVTGYTVLTVRKLVKTEMQHEDPLPKSAPFTNEELIISTITMGISLCLAVLKPNVLGSVPLTALPFLLTSTMVGYILGSRFPQDVRRVFHPIITCALMANVGALTYGAITGLGYRYALGFAAIYAKYSRTLFHGAYLTKNPLSPGAGDLLMGFLGSVIISFAFSIFRQRKLVQRHAVEILSAVLASSLFSLYSTAMVGHALGLDPLLTRAIIPRCVTVALALPIASLLEASNPSLTAAVVVLTGLVGANFGQLVLDKLGLSDPISRGMAIASSAHGLGTAALSAKEPDALPFCAIAYAFTGIACSLICSLPIVQGSLLFLSR